MDEKSRLLGAISRNGDEDGILDFLDEYNLDSTKEATFEQLEKYIAKKEWLEPCPFCGNENVRIGRLGRVCTITCFQCGTVVSYISHEDKEPAIKAWNRRA